MDAEIAARSIHSADERVPVADLELGVRWLQHAAHDRLCFELLELHEPEGAFEALEAYLADELRAGLVADLYLGYGLSQTLRREPWPPPPEPCRLPLAAAAVRPA